ncbi:MAG: UvrD-helicase domain-containing protein, partial [Opitutales bacterium]|nr:UvrD-helicase domain-containing protein [Opitutales bacterium]
MNNLGNLIISASAGSGKTFRLTTRFLFMLLHDLDPTRTVALTFSRSTAGEFLLSILQRLAKASQDQDTRIELERLFKADFKDLSQPEVSQDSCMKALRQLTAQLHRLNLWTIDSFFHRILSVFPFEFGLTGGFNILREYEEESIRHQVLVRLLQDATGQDLQKLALNFLSANSGKASGRFFPEFSKFVGNNHPILLEVGDDSRWGNPSMIWNGPCPYTSLDEPDRSRHIEVFKSEISTVEHGTIRNSLNRFISKLEKWNPGGKIDIPKCIQVAWQDISAFRQGNGYCTHGSREFPLSSALASAIGILLSDILARELDVRLERTSGRLQLLRAYEDLYRKEVRERGLLTFADLPVLLNPTQEGTPFLSHQPGEVERLWMDYRM